MPRKNCGSVRRVWSLVAFIAAAGYGVYSLVRSNPAAAADPLGDIQTPTPTRLTTSGDVNGCASISPDGKYVVYCDFAGQLEVYQVATGSTITLGPHPGPTIFSPR